MTEDLLCPECGARLHEHHTPGIGTVLVGHAFTCSYNPKPSPGPFKRPRRMSPPPTRTDALAEKALRGHGGVPAGCALHDWPGPALECPGCLAKAAHIADLRAIGEVPF